MSEPTLRALRARYARLGHCRMVALAEGQEVQVAAWTVTAIEVPHAREPVHRPSPGGLRSDGRSIVYASDVAHLTRGLESFAAGASLLVLDGAMWRRRLFSHLTIDEALPKVCEWDVARSVDPDRQECASPSELAREVAALCPRARPAYDGLEVAV